MLSQQEQSKHPVHHHQRKRIPSQRQRGSGDVMGPLAPGAWQHCLRKPSPGRYACCKGMQSTLLPQVLLSKRASLSS